MNNQNTNVQSITRIFRLIELLSLHPEGIALQKISELSKIPKTTTHRLLSNLMALDYATQIPLTGHYKLTLKLFEISSNVVNNTDIYSAAKEPLDILASDTGEVVHLVMRDNTEIVYIYKAISRATRMSSRAGSRAPMYRTAVGKSILATLPDDEIKRIWLSSKIEKVTLNTITDLTDLMEEIYQVRRSGYAIDNEENELGTKCVGFSLPGLDKYADVAFSISVPTPLLNEARFKELVILGKKVQRNILYNVGIRL